MSGAARRLREIADIIGVDLKAEDRKAAAVDTARDAISCLQVRISSSPGGTYFTAQGVLKAPNGDALLPLMRELRGR